MVRLHHLVYLVAIFYTFNAPPPLYTLPVGEEGEVLHNILQGKSITVYCGKDRVDLDIDFTYIDDIVKGCLGTLDTVTKSTGSCVKGGKKNNRLTMYMIFTMANTNPMFVQRRIGWRCPGMEDVPFTRANVTKARKEIGYKPTTDLNTSFKKFFKWNLGVFVPTVGSRLL